MNKLAVKFIVVFVMFLHFETKAQNFGLIKDINTSKDASPVNYINDLYLRLDNDFFIHIPDNGKYAVLNGVTYFAADDGVHGIELWRSDATANGTFMVKDINVGNTSSNIQSLTVAGNKLFFTSSQIVYMSDGTDAGTVAVPGISYTGDQTTCLTAVGNTLYFLTNVSRLWKTDGTLAGTSMIIDFRATYFYSTDFLGQLTNLNGTLFFTTGIDNNNGTELWKSDGTLAGTIMVKDINPGTGSSRPGNLTVVNGKLYFSAFDGSGLHLWSTDGTMAGTQPVVNTIGAVLPQTDITPLTVINNVLFFNASTAATGAEVYEYDPANSAAGIGLVKDINQGTAGSNPVKITAVGDKNIYFSAVNASAQTELWKSNGTLNGTKVLKTLSSGKDYFSNLTDAAGQLIFTFTNSENGTELWRSDGTPNGTVLVKDIYPGNHSSNISGITYFNNGVLLFNANDGVTGNELWRTNGVANATVMVKNINDNSTAPSYPDLYSALAVNNKVYFSATDPVYGTGLYSTDGTTGGTQLIKDLYPGNSPHVSNFSLFKNLVCFSADSSGFTSIYRTDGTAAGTVKIFNTGKQNSTVTQMVASSKYLYVFFYDADSSRNELWVSDGTAGNSYKIQNLSSSYPNGVAVGNNVFFIAQDTEHGAELWKATPVAGSAKMVKDIYPGTQSSNINGLRVLNNKVYFGASDGSNGYANYLYVSDGSPAGTQVVYNVPLANGLYNAGILNNKLFFSCTDAVTGSELYVSDGTTAGTSLLKDINAGDQGSYPYSFTAVGNTLYFQASDLDHGGELWKTDGTSNGTLPVKDIYPGSFGSYPINLTAADGKLYFTASDISGSYILYVSNGKPSGTKPVNDAGLLGVSINNLKGTNTKLLINGYNYYTGSELYAGTVTGIAATTQEISESNIIPAGSLRATIMGNPVHDVLNLSIDISKQQRTRITVADASGRIMINDSRLLGAGKNAVAYPSGVWMPGVYVLKITADDGGTVLLKIMK
ncbi:MAG: ELWxxDGT repeat protein [Panacibacter sp.]